MATKHILFYSIKSHKYILHIQYFVVNIGLLATSVNLIVFIARQHTDAYARY